MSKMHFTSILPASKTPQIFARPLNRFEGFFKDTLSTTTLLLLGAALQSLLLAIAPTRVALLPAALLLLARFVITALQATAVLPNAYMAQTIHGKATAQIPAPDGSGARTSLTEQPVVVLLLGIQVNHPLGMFAPGVREIGQQFANMETELREKADEYGLLGASSWRGDNHRATANQSLFIFYFRDVEGVHRFAHGPAHRVGWDAYNKMGHRHIGFMHETFSVPKKAYESIYLNCAPNLLGATSVKRVQDDEGNGLDEPEWMSPLVAADKGVMRSTFGRLGRSAGAEQEKYGDIPKWHGVESGP